MITYIEDIYPSNKTKKSSILGKCKCSRSSRERIASSGWRTEILQRSSISPCARIQHTHTHTQGNEKGFLCSPRGAIFLSRATRFDFTGKCSRKKTSENRKTLGGSGKLKLGNLVEKVEGWESAGRIPRDSGKEMRKPLETGNSN